MNYDNPFEKLGALDQQLYQDTNTHDDARDNVTEIQPREKQEKTSVLQTNKLANQQRRKLVYQQTYKPAN